MSKDSSDNEVASSIGNLTSLCQGGISGVSNGLVQEFSKSTRLAVLVAITASKSQRMVIEECFNIQVITFFDKLKEES